MYIKKENEYQYHPVIVKMLEDLPGGGVVKALCFPSLLDEVAPGVVMYKGSDGLLCPIKSAKATATATSSATEYTAAGHHFKVDEFVTVDGLLAASKKVTAVNGDKFTLEATLAVEVTTSTVFVQAATTATAGSATLVGDPIGVSNCKVDLTVANQTTGVCVRGTVNQEQLVYPLSTSVATKLTLIRFE